MTDYRIIAAIAACLAFHTGAAKAQVNGMSMPFLPQTVETVSPPTTVTIANSGVADMQVASVVAPSDVAVRHECNRVAPGSSCPMQVSFAPVAFPGSATASQAITRTISVFTQGNSTPVVITLTGTAEKSLATHFYRSILRREPDAEGKAYWNGEAERMAAAGADVNEAWYSLAALFFSSGEYQAQATTTRAYVTDLFRTFLAREPDTAGLLYWIGQIDSGMPREVARVALMFSPEFRTLSNRIYGVQQVRAETNVVMDFYRGLLNRLPDGAGYTSWVQRFRAAQCKGAAAVESEVEAISSAFMSGSEYAARSRSNAQFVADLYDAFMRRGGDLGGVQFWIGQLDTGARTRDQVRRDFMASPEFRARVNAVLGESCLSAG
jgi:hypothetical protein